MRIRRIIPLVILSLVTIFVSVLSATQVTLSQDNQVQPAQDDTANVNDVFTAVGALQEAGELQAALDLIDGVIDTSVEPKFEFLADQADVTALLKERRRIEALQMPAWYAQELQAIATGAWTIVKWLAWIALASIAAWFLRSLIRGFGVREGLWVSVGAKSEDAAPHTNPSQDLLIDLQSRFRAGSGSLEVGIESDVGGTAFATALLSPNVFDSIPLESDQSVSFGPVKFSPIQLLAMIKSALRPRYQWEIRGDVHAKDDSATLVCQLTKCRGKEDPIPLSIRRDGPAAYEHAIRDLGSLVIFHVTPQHSTNSAASYMDAWAARRIIDSVAEVGHRRETLQSAAAHLRRAIQIDRSNLPARCGLAVALRDMGRLDEAAAHLEFLRGELATGSERAAQLQLERPEIAWIVDYNYAATLLKKPNDWESHNQALDLLESMLATIQSDTALDPATRDTMELLIRSALAMAMPFEIAEARKRARASDKSRAIARADELLLKIRAQLGALNPVPPTNPPSFHHARIDDRQTALAVIMNANGYGMYLKSQISGDTRLNEPEEMIRHAMVLKPDFTDAYVNLATILHKRGRRGPEIERLVLHALELDPDNAKANGLLGWCYNRRGEYKDAVTYLERNRDWWQACLTLSEIYDRHFNEPGSAAAAKFDAIRLNSSLSDGVRVDAAKLALAMPDEDPRVVGLIREGLKVVNDLPDQQVGDLKKALAAKLRTLRPDGSKDLAPEKPAE